MKTSNMSIFLLSFVLSLLAIIFISTSASSYSLRAREIVSAPLDEPICASYMKSSIVKLYRESLTGDTLENYEALEHGLRTLDPVITLPHKTSSEEISRMLEYVMNDNPDIFWVDVEYSIMSQWDSAVSMSPHYLWNEGDIRKKLSRYEEIADDVLAHLPADAPSYRQMDEICRHVAARCQYEYDDEKTSSCQGIDSVFTNGKSVCAGYARAVQFIALKHGLKCSYVSGIGKFRETDGPHAWNVLYDEDGNASFYDATWADGGSLGITSFWSARAFEFFPFHQPDFPTVIPKSI